MDQIIRFCATVLAVVVLVTEVTSTTAITSTSTTTTTTSTATTATTKTSTQATTTLAKSTATTETATSPSQVNTFVNVPGNCPLGMVWREGDQVIMLATLMKGTGAAFARTSCLSRGARPLFLNTQQDANLLHRILRDCDKSERLGGVWVPVRRHQQLKKVMYSQKAAWMTGSSNSGRSADTWEFDWLNAKFDWYTGNVMLHPFPKDVSLEGIICIKN